MNSDVGNLIEATTQKEIEAFANFSRTYRIEHQEPKRPALRLAGLLSWEFYATIVVAVCAVLLAATRTAPTFYQIAVNDGFDGVFAVFSGAISLVAVEGLLFMGALIRASKTSDIESTWSLKVAEGIAVVISMIAGLHFVFGSFPSLATYNNDIIMALALIIGVGATVLAWVAGSIVGNQIAKARSMSEGLSGTYKEDSEKYRSSLLAAWKSSDERKIAREELRSAVGRTAERTTERTRAVRSVETANERTNERGGNGTNEVRERVFAYLDEFVSLHPNSDIPGPTKIAEDLDMSKSHASVVKGEWTILRGRA